MGEFDIALQAGQNLPQFGPNWGVVQNALKTQIAIQQQRDIQEAQNALRAAYGNQSNLEPGTSQLKPGALNALMARSPNAGIDAFKLNNALAQQTNLNAFRQSEILQNWTKQAQTGADQIYGQYKASLDKGVDPKTALDNAQADYTKMLQGLRSGGMPANIAQMMSPTFDPMRIEGRIQAQNLAKDAEKAKERDVNFKTETDYGKSPPVQYRQYDSGKTTDLAGNPYSPTGVGKQTGEANVFVGKDPATNKEVRFRYAPTGPVSADEKGEPVEVSKLTGVHKIGSTATPDVNDEQVTTTAKAIAGYQQPPLSGYALRAPGAQAVMAKVLELNPDYQAARYPEVAKAMRDFGTGTQGNTTRSLNVAIDHLDSMRELVDALKGGDVNVINRAANLVKTELGLSSAPNTFNAARSIIGGEVAKAVVGGASALGDREEARKPIDAARSPEQLYDVIAEYKRLMAGQLNGLERQYQDATGFGPDSQFAFRKKLDPRTIAELDRAKTPNSSGEATAKIPPKSQAAPSGEMPPPAVVQMLKEGQETGFSNGQVWTLRDGKPVRVK